MLGSILWGGPFSSQVPKCHNLTGLSKHALTLSNIEHLEHVGLNPVGDLFSSPSSQKLSRGIPRAPHKPPGAPRSTPGGPRRSQEVPGVPRSSQEVPRAPRNSQERPGAQGPKPHNLACISKHALTLSNIEHWSMLGSILWGTPFPG